MPQLSGSVGSTKRVHGTNRPGDVALVQVMLRVVTDAKTKQPFFNHKVNGLCNAQTIAAIGAFQKAFGFVAAPAVPVLAGAPAGKPKTASAGAPAGNLPASAAGVALEQEGLMNGDSASFQKLSAEAIRVKPDWTRLRALGTTRYLYLEMTPVQLETARSEIKAADLDDDFKDTVIELVDAVYLKHKIVLKGWNSQKSYLRSFRDQHNALHEGSSQLHPGEGLHNYGYAIDVGYTGLMMILDDGDDWLIEGENDFDDLAKMHGYGRQNALFKARNDIWEAPPQGNGELFRIRLHQGKDNDPNHFQDYNQFSNLYPDDCVSTSRSLAEHLTKVASPDGEDWSWKALGNHHYATDLGWDIDPVDVGTADQLWAGHPTLTRPQYLAARNAALKKKNQPLLKEAEVAKEYEDDIKALNQAFAQAEKAWRDWEALKDDGTSL